MKKIPLTEKHQALLEKRGIDPELAVRLGVQSCGTSETDFIAIPYLAGGKTVNHKYRTLAGEKRFQQDAEARKCFWNFDCLTDESLADQPLIITEGELDAMIALQCGFARVVSVPDGAPAEAIGDDPNSRKYSYLDDAKAELKAVREIIICADNDQPGINLLSDLGVRLGRQRCKWVKYPKGCKDLNDAFVKYGAAGVQQTIERAQWCAVPGVYKLSDLPPVPDVPAFDTGIPMLRNHYNVRPGDLCIVTGIPSMGKTSVINDICCNLVSKHGWKVCFASFEQKPQIDHRRNLRTWHARRLVRDMDPKQLVEADAWIDRHFSFIVPSEDDNVTLDWTLEKAAVAALRFGAKVIVIDPWNEMDHVRPRDMSLTEYVGEAIKAFKRLAVKYQVHVIVAAHPSKQQKEANGQFKIPTLYDISDSAHWYNKADVGLVVHRLDERKTVVRIAKSRYHDQIGRPGDVECVFDPHTNRFNPFDELAPRNVRNWVDPD